MVPAKVSPDGLGLQKHFGFARRVLVCLPTVSLNIPHGTKLGLGNCDHLEGSPKVNLCPCGHSLCRCELRK